MMEIKKYISSVYEDIVLLDETRNKYIVLISLTDKKYNGTFMKINSNDVYEDISYYEIDYKLRTVEDLKKTKYFTVVINNESLLFRRNDQIILYNFRKNTYSRNFNYESIYNIKSNLKFKNTI